MRSEKKRRRRDRTNVTDKGRNQRRIREKTKNGCTGMSGLMFPKQPTKKKRKKHKNSILHRKDGTCYLCIKSHRDFRHYSIVHEHHVFGGSNRRLSEEYGLKVYLCPSCHNFGRAAVHTNHANMLILQQDAQRAFEQEYSHEKFMELFGRNYL